METNPYQSLASDSLQSPVEDSAVPAIYASAHVRALVAQGLLGVHLVLTVLTLFGLRTYRVLLEQSKSGAYPEILQAHVQYMLLLSMGLALTFLATAVAYWIWSYRATTNLRALGVERLRYRPFWTILVWFIPFVNLVLPYGMVKDLWVGSDPETPTKLNLAQRRPQSRGMAIIRVWWAVWVAMLFSAVMVEASAPVFAPPGGNNKLFEALFFNSQLAIGSNLLRLVAAALGIAIIYCIDQRQTKRALRLGVDLRDQPRLT